MSEEDLADEAACRMKQFVHTEDASFVWMKTCCCDFSEVPSLKPILPSKLEGRFSIVFRSINFQWLSMAMLVAGSFDVFCNIFGVYTSWRLCSLDFFWVFPCLRSLLQWPRKQACDAHWDADKARVSWMSPAMLLVFGRSKDGLKDTLQTWSWSERQHVKIVMWHNCE